MHLLWAGLAVFTTIFAILDGSFSKSRFDDVLQSTRIKHQDSQTSLFDSDVSLTMLPGELRKLRESKAFQSGPYVNPVAKSGKNCFNTIIRVLAIFFQLKINYFRIFWKSGRERLLTKLISSVRCWILFKAVLMQLIWFVILWMYRWLGSLLLMKNGWWKSNPSVIRGNWFIRCIRFVSLMQIFSWIMDRCSGSDPVISGWWRNGRRFWFWENEWKGDYGKVL